MVVPKKKYYFDPNIFPNPKIFLILSVKLNITFADELIELLSSSQMFSMTASMQTLYTAHWFFLTCPFIEESHTKGMYIQIMIQTFFLTNMSEHCTNVTVEKLSISINSFSIQSVQVSCKHYFISCFFSELCWNSFLVQNIFRSLALQILFSKYRRDWYFFFKSNHDFEKRHLSKAIFVILVLAK